ncbi:PRC-barrel domain-containing protein [Saccharopolyspora erythraea]|uniref:PRC-barrel domain-containing protein n=1 Tax=Saccharopolyspora erythraea TaxID=1836 RepID=UPI001BA66D9E|nr:PRC-barrel domain-containing protein [Saccharopolyspora erythraea]QUH00013.1 PRC-barrel domain-containing protein [Saccharopolyspora erythraea]
MDVERAQDLIGTAVYDRSGVKIGRVGNVYVHDSTHQPEWVTVRCGFLGSRETFVPLNGASTEEDRIDVSVSKDMVKFAPRVAAEHGHLSDEEGRDLYSHYGISELPGAETTGAPGAGQTSGDAKTTTGRHRRHDG